LNDDSILFLLRVALSQKLLNIIDVRALLHHATKDIFQDCQLEPHQASCDFSVPSVLEQGEPTKHAQKGQVI
jgi:hypothetical protein